LATVYVSAQEGGTCGRRELNMPALEFSFPKIKRNFMISRHVDSKLKRSRTVRRSRFGDGTFRRWWSQMFYAKKMCFWNTL